MRSTVERAIRDHGQDLEIRGDEGTLHERGYKNSGDRTVMFLPEVRVRVGDWIVDEDGAEYLVEDISRLSERNGLLALKAHYKTKAQHESEQRAFGPSNTWHIGQAHHSNLNSGVQGDIDMSVTYDFRGMEELITRHADPADAERFREVLEEIRGQIERDGAIKGGSLRRFNDLMNDAGWFTGPLAGVVMQFLAGGAV